MTTVTVSPDFHIEIPKTLRDEMQIRVGQQFQLIQYGDRIEWIPLKKIQELKGVLKGMDTSIQREGDRI